MKFTAKLMAATLTTMAILLASPAATNIHEASAGEPKTETMPASGSGSTVEIAVASYLTDKDRNCEKTAGTPVNSGRIELKMPARSIMTLTTCKP